MIDGFFLRFLIEEIKPEIIDSYVEKVFQPSKDELVIKFRSPQKVSLLLNINSSVARVCLTQQKINNPSFPNMFCMLARKYLNNAKLIEIKQVKFDRVIFFDFETSNEIGNKIFVRLIFELMGRYSNIILIDSEGLIIDAIKRVNYNMSRVRQILPKKEYRLISSDNKLDLLTDDLELIIKRLMSFSENTLKEGLLKSIIGISPILAKEISYRVLSDDNKPDINDIEISKIGLNEVKKLKLELIKIREIIETKTGLPLMFIKDNIPKYFSFMELKSLKNELKLIKLGSFNELIEAFYYEKGNQERRVQNSKDLITLLNNSLKRLENKLALQREEKKECEGKDLIQQQAILLQSNLYLIEKNMEQITLDNFFDDNKKITIKLDKRISAPANAERYFNRYKKLCSADKKLDELIENTQNEIIYLESVIDNIMRSDSPENIEQIKSELQKEGYLKNRKKQGIKERKTSPLNSIYKTKSKDGLEIFVGNNNVNNDWLTLKYANKNDMWLHIQKKPGAHVIIKTNGAEVSQDTIIEAAVLAAKNSKGKDEKTCLIDYTKIKNVKKFKGAKPGMVIYDNFKTVIVKLK